MSTKLNHLKTELTTELNNILGYWSEFTIDKENQGFIGQIDYNNKKKYQAEKGSVLNARILWAFSSGYQKNC